MSYNLFLDDIRSPNDVANYISPVELAPLYRRNDWIIVRNYSEFVSYIEEHGLPTLISFDHDLAPEHYSVSIEDLENDPSIKELYGETGYDCAKWLAEYCLQTEQRLPACIVHSANPVGALNIKTYLKNYKKHHE